VHPVVAAAAQDLLNKSPNERSSIVSTAMSLLSLYHDPVVAKVTRRCSWRIADLVEGKRPATLYLVIPPSDISRTRPLMRLILNQIGRRLTEDLESSSQRHKLLLMLDEFPALGRLDFFESSLAFMAGYGIKSFLIAQSLNQIEQAYGQNNAILDNCHVRVTFATNDERTAKRVSDALGTTTQLRAMKNFAGHRLSPWLGHLMVSRSETPRALMTVDEIINLPERDEIVMVSGVRPIRAKKARFYEDARLAARILPPPDVSADDRPARPDDWSKLAPLPEPALPKPIQQNTPKPGAPESNGNADSGTDDDDDQSMVPEHRHHIDISPPISLPANEFDPDAQDEERRKLFGRRQAIERQQADAARRASMDRDDGIEL
jgi:type IV secretion system protein VirD4